MYVCVFLLLRESLQCGLATSYTIVESVEFTCFKKAGIIITPVYYTGVGFRCTVHHNTASVPR